MSKFRFCIILLVLSYVFPLVSVFSQEEQSIWEDTKNAIVDNSETISNVSTVISDFARNYGGTAGLIVSSIFALASIAFAGVAKIRKNRVLSEQDKRELVTQALRATINAIDAYKDSKKGDGDADVNKVNELLKSHQDEAGDKVRETVRNLRAAIKGETNNK